MTYVAARAALKELADARRARQARDAAAPVEPAARAMPDIVEVKASIDHRPLLWPFPVWVSGYCTLSIGSPGDVGLADEHGSPFEVSSRDVRFPGGSTPLVGTSQQTVTNRERTLVVSAGAPAPPLPLRCHGLLHLDDTPWLVLDPICVNIHGWHLCRVDDGRRAALVTQRHGFGDRGMVVTLHAGALDIVVGPSSGQALAQSMNRRLGRWDVTRSFFQTPWITIDGLPRARTYEGAFIGPELDEERPGDREQDLDAVEHCCPEALMRARALAAVITGLDADERRRLANAAPYVVDARSLWLDEAAWTAGVKRTAAQWEAAVRVAFAAWDDDTERSAPPDGTHV